MLSAALLLPPDNDKYSTLHSIYQLVEYTILHSIYCQHCILHSIDECGILRIQVEKDAPKLETPPERRKSMPASKAQQKAVSKYMKENYDVYQIRMKKGKKDIIQAHAEQKGQSVNAYINSAIDEKMCRDDLEAGTTVLTGGIYSESEKTAPAASESLTEGVADGN